MRRRLAVAPVLKGACAAAALAGCSVAQAASVQAVFSAENALYGAGYEIGQADGWIDDNLRDALRHFQSDRPGLKATGELDPDTLAALGIPGQSSRAVGGNVAASREAARQELGLVVASLNKPEPQPAPEPQPLAKPEPEPEPVIAAVSEPAPEPEPQPTPEPAVVEKTDPISPVSSVTRETPEARAEPEPEPQVDVASPEPTSEPIQIAAITRPDGQLKKSDRPATEQAVSADVGNKTIEVASAANDAETAGDVEARQSAQQTAEQSRETTSPERSVSSESSGNFLTKLFDFLFGWLV